MNPYLRKYAAKHKSNPYEATSSPVVYEEVTGVIPNAFTGHVPNYLGAILGMASDIDKNREKRLTEDLDDYTAASILPGVTGYRNALRGRLADRLASKGKVDRAGMFSELGGIITSPLALAALGGALGVGIGHYTDNSMVEGLPIEYVGSGLGFSLGAIGSLAGLALGLYRRRRSQEEHAEYLEDDGMVAKNLLVPGVAGHNVGRRARMGMAAALDA